MIRRILLITLSLLMAAAPCVATENRYVSPDRLKQWLASDRKVVIVDLQPSEEFRERHFDGSTWIGPLPGKGRAALKNLDRIAKKQLRSGAEIVIVSCNGGDDARQALERLSGRGLARKRLLILEHGMDAAMHGVGCECCLTKDRADQQSLGGSPPEKTTPR